MFMKSGLYNITGEFDGPEGVSSRVIISEMSARPKKAIVVKHSDTMEAKIREIFNRNPF